MDIVEKSGAYCSGFIHAQPSVGLLASFRGKDDLCTFWIVLKACGELMVEVC
jgi:hypothetical protein